MSLIPDPKYYLEVLGFDNVEEWASTFDCYILGEKGFWFDEDGSLVNLDRELMETIQNEFKLDDVDDWCHRNGIRFKNEYDYQVEDGNGNSWDDFKDCYWEFVFEDVLSWQNYRLRGGYKEEMERLEAVKKGLQGISDWPEVAEK